MSFHASAADIELDGHMLKAKLRNEDGEYVDAQLDLSRHIGNDEGSFKWGGENFHESAQDIKLTLEPREDGDVPILWAMLSNSEGEEGEANINLAECIGNENGVLVCNCT